MASVTRTQTTAYWIKLFEDKAVPCGPINNIDESFADAQVQHRNIWVKQAADHSGQAYTATKTIAKTMPDIGTVASPLRLQDTPPVLRHAPPAMGQHTDEVLAGLGFTPEKIAALRQVGVV
jgi:crotonobetainyl-CoA:carnitine CoA-transferase CaiB-like acyl-CoA transferase